MASESFSWPPGIREPVHFLVLVCYVKHFYQEMITAKQCIFRDTAGAREISELAICTSSHSTHNTLDKYVWTSMEAKEHIPLDFWRGMFSLVEDKSNDKDSY